MSDAAFLAEVEDFLTSCDLPLCPPAQLLRNEDGNSNMTSGSPTIPTPLTSPTKPALNVKNSRSKPKKQTLDTATKRELEKAKDRKRRRAYRERQRLERDVLKLQVEELSSTLTELQETKLESGQTSPSVWQAIASRQLQARLDAETEQQNLVAAVDARAAMIQEFTSFVQDRLSFKSEVVEEELEDTGPKPKRMRLESSDEGFFKILLQELDAVYRQTDEILKASGLDTTEVDWDGSGQKWREDSDTGYYQYLDKLVLTHGFQQTCDSLWKVAHMPHRQESRQAFDKVEDPESTTAYKFRVTTRLKSGRAVSILQRSATRRYRQDGCEVFVWRAFTEGEGLFTGMHADETGWVVAIPLTNMSTERTLMRICIHHTPMHFSNVETREPDIKQFTGVLLDEANKDGTETTSGLKKMLLEAS